MSAMGARASGRVALLVVWVYALPGCTFGPSCGGEADLTGFEFSRIGSGETLTFVHSDRAQIRLADGSTAHFRVRPGGEFRVAAECDDRPAGAGLRLFAMDPASAWPRARILIGARGGATLESIELPDRTDGIAVTAEVQAYGASAWVDVHMGDAPSDEAIAVGLVLRTRDAMGAAVEETLTIPIAWGCPGCGGPGLGPLDPAAFRPLLGKPPGCL